MRSPCVFALLLAALPACTASEITPEPPAPARRAAAAAAPGFSEYDSSLGAPACAAVGPVCTTGPLVRGRGPLGPEAGAPNTIGNSCPDGPRGRYHVDMSLDELAVQTADGSDLTPGKRALVFATVWASNAQPVKALDLFAAADARAPRWIAIGSVGVSGTGLQHLAIEYTLPDGDFQAVRGVLRSRGYRSPCPTGSFDEADDLAFAVAGGAPTPPPGPVLEAAAYDPQLGVPACTAAGIGCTSGDLLRPAAAVPVEPNAPNTIWRSCWDPSSTTPASAPAIDAISIATLDGSSLAAGKRVRVTADASLLSPGARVDLFHLPDTRSTAWTLAGAFVASGPGAGRFQAEMTLPPGPRQMLRAVAGAPHQTVCGGTDQDDLVFAVTTPAGAAFYDPDLHVPACPVESASCDSGPLLTGRAQLGPEANTPNTLDGCTDGGTEGPPGTTAPSVEALKVSSLDDRAITAMHGARIEATVRAVAGSVVDLFAADSLGSWRHLGRAVPAEGRQVIALTYTPTANGLGAVRAVIDDLSTGPQEQTCSRSGRGEADDLAFAVAQPDGTSDYAPPVVSLLAPATSGPLTSLPLHLAAEASDDLLLQRVEFYVDQERVATVFQPPFTFDWTPASPLVPGRSIRVFARAFDGVGRFTESPYVDLSPGDFVPPTVGFLSPSPGAVLRPLPLAVEVQADDGWAGSGLVQVDLLADGVPVGTAAAQPWVITWDPTGASEGPHTLLAVARDAAGNQGSAAVTIVIDATPPAGAIVSPVAGAYVRGLIPVQAAGQDANGYAYAVVRIDGLLRGYAWNGPYLWDTSAYADGEHLLGALLADQPGNSIETVPFPVVVDNTAPTVSLSAPAAGAVVEGPVEVAVSASDALGLARVELLVDDVTLLSTTSPPLAATWDPTAVADGGHTVRARAIDLAGNSAEASLVVLVDRETPTVAVTWPQVGSNLGGTVSVQVSASDPNGIARVEIWARNDSYRTPFTRVAIASPNAHGHVAAWDTTALGLDGSYSLYARAVDGAGREATSVVVPYLYVDNTPPSVSITAPVGGAVVAGRVEVRTEQYDSGLVAGLQYVIDGNTDVGWRDPAYLPTLSWDTTRFPNGPHTLVVRAMDTVGNVRESASVQIQILNPPAPGNQLLFDTGFEEGSAGPWLAKSPSVFRPGPVQATYGVSATALLGGRGGGYSDYVQQQFVVPSFAVELTVSYGIRVSTSETSSSACDQLRVRLYFPSTPTGTPSLGVASHSNLDAATGRWEQKWVTMNVESYRGKALTLAFESTETYSLPTSFELDDVTVTWR